MTGIDQPDTSAPAAPPGQDEYPPGALVCVVDDLEGARAAVAAARPWSTSEPYVIEAPDVLRLREARDQDQGSLRRLYLMLGALVSDQGMLEDRYLEEARAGHPMVVASADDDEQSERAWAALKAAGARSGLWLSKTSLREML